MKQRDFICRPHHFPLSFFLKIGIPPGIELFAAEYSRIETNSSVAIKKIIQGKFKEDQDEWKY